MTLSPKPSCDHSILTEQSDTLQPWACRQHQAQSWHSLNFLLCWPLEYRFQTECNTSTNTKKISLILFYSVFTFSTSLPPTLAYVHALLLSFCLPPFSSLLLIFWTVKHMPDLFWNVYGEKETKWWKTILNMCKRQPLAHQTLFCIAHVLLAYVFFQY